MGNRVKELYFNDAQLEVLTVNAPLTYCVMGRGTGKSSGILAPKAKECAELMPGGTGALVGATYNQLLTRTLPSFVTGLARLGLIEDYHFFIGKMPPKKWNWPRPIESPKSYKHFISFFNGYGIHLISQDRKGSSNGLNIDHIMVDEAKELDYDQFAEETLPTMRANSALFGHLPCHRSIWMTTSMPTAADGKWILKKQEDMDDDRVRVIKMIHEAVNRLMSDFDSAGKTEQDKILKKILKLEGEANRIRMPKKDENGIIIPNSKMTFYKEASSMVNYVILRQEFFADMKQTLPDFIYRTEILNERPDTTDNCFYPALDVTKHTYPHKYNDRYLEGLGYDFKKALDVTRDCRMDGDINYDKRLICAIDFGGRFNCLSIAQNYDNTLFFINNLFVKHPFILDDLADNFCDYYDYLPLKVVKLIPDHTGFNQLANDNYTYADQFCRRLTMRGWKVELSERRAAPSHQEKFLLNNKILSGSEQGLPKVLINKQKCKEMLNSMLLAPLSTDNKGIKKDKASERNKNVQAEDATHLSDTFDIMVESMFYNYIDSQPSFTAGNF